MDQSTTDVIIVGAGPIGLETAADILAAGLDCVILEAGSVGQTIADWPSDTPFFSSPERCAVAGVPIQNQHQSMLRGEEYLSYLRQVVEIRDLPVFTYTPVQTIKRTSDGFVLTAGPEGLVREYRSRYVVLATGNMNRPRRLGVPGENLPHVAHRFTDVHRYFRRRLLVVGGRNSAVEAAIRCWRAGAEVTVSYRGPRFEKKKLNSRYHLEISILTDKGKIGFLPETEIKEIRRDRVVLSSPGGQQEYPCDDVLIQAGYESDLSLMEMAGVTLEGAERIPRMNPETMETDVPGLFLAGTASGGGKLSYKIFVATSHHHGPTITKRLTGRDAAYSGSIPARAYPFDNADITPTEGDGDEPSSPAEPLPKSISG
jgi:thioredoxin reductase (NADPH)